MANYDVPTTGSGGATAGGSGVSGQDTVTFTAGVDSVALAVVDTGVAADSIILCSVATGARDSDELELAPITVGVGTITPGAGYTLIAVSLDGDAEGTFTINYQRVS